MKYASIHTARITRAIVEWCKDHGRELPEYSAETNDESQIAVSMFVRDMLKEDSIAVDELDAAYHEVTGRFGCPFSVEEALIMPVYGFNACPMEAWLHGEVCLERAIEICFRQTYVDAMVEEYGEPDQKPEEKAEPSKLKVVSTKQVRN